MEEQFITQIPSLSFNTKRRKYPYSYEFLNRSFDFSEGSLLPYNPKIKGVGFNSKSTNGQSNDGKGGMGGLYAMIGQIGNSLPQAKRNEAFINSVYGRRAWAGRDKISKGFDTGEKALGAIPNPLTQAIAGFSKLGRGIGRQTTDEYGIYKNKFSEGIDNSFNPERGVHQVSSVFKDAFDGKGFDMNNLVNLGSMGFLGESSAQKEAKKMKNLFIKSNEINEMQQNQLIGNQISSAIPKYQAPVYGKNGMKFKTKFSGY